jgi:hypothetical protein
VLGFVFARDEHGLGALARRNILGSGGSSYAAVIDGEMTLSWHRVF